MHEVLEKIIDNKKRLVEKLYQEVEKPGSEIVRWLENHKRKQYKPDFMFKFSKCLKEDGLSVIAEIKRRSPSAGEIAPTLSPENKALNYMKSGAKAISVLTEELFFGGSKQDFESVLAVVDVPLLRKDFIVDYIQIVESAFLGASAVLLIVRFVGDKLALLISKCASLGLEALVEVHTVDELEKAVEAGAKIIGVNNRNLETFEVDINNCMRIVGQIPDGVVRVAESGIKTVSDAIALFDVGYDAVLIGQALSQATDPGAFIRRVRRLTACRTM